MRIIPTSAHGSVDYSIGSVLIIASWLLRLPAGPADWVPVFVGVSVLCYSLLTDYELGMVRFIPMPIHLGVDVLAGAFLLASPWLFGFAREVHWPHVIVGALILGTVFLSQPVPVRASVRGGTRTL